MNFDESKFQKSRGTAARHKPVYVEPPDKCAAHWSAPDENMYNAATWGVISPLTELSGGSRAWQ